MSKDLISKAVSKSAKGIVELLKVLELHAGLLNDGEFNAIFAHLTNSTKTVYDRATAARLLSKAGSFSFDQAAPLTATAQAPASAPVFVSPATPAPAPAPVQVAQPIVVPAAVAAKAAWVAPTGRIAKSSDDPLAGQLITAPVSIPGEIDDVLDGVVEAGTATYFMEDK